jgi:hypothetical protein
VGVWVLWWCCFRCLSVVCKVAVAPTLYLSPMLLTQLDMPFLPKKLKEPRLLRFQAGPVGRPPRGRPTRRPPAARRQLPVCRPGRQRARGRLGRPRQRAAEPERRDQLGAEHAQGGLGLGDGAMGGCGCVASSLLRSCPTTTPTTPTAPLNRSRSASASATRRQRPRTAAAPPPRPPSTSPTVRASSRAS